MSDPCCRLWKQLNSPGVKEIVLYFLFFHTECYLVVMGCYCTFFLILSLVTKTNWLVVGLFGVKSCFTVPGCNLEVRNHELGPFVSLGLNHVNEWDCVVTPQNGDSINYIFPPILRVLHRIVTLVYTTWWG